MTSLVIYGDTSGSIALTANSVAGTNTLTLPASTGTLISNKTVGTILQVVSNTTSTQVTVSSTAFTDSGLSGTITPTSATSKILVMITQSFDVYSPSRGDNGIGLQLLRGSTVIWNPSVCGTANASIAGYGAGYINAGGATAMELDLQVPITYLDSPATANAITYKTQGGLYTTASSSVLTFQPNSTGNPGKSSIIMMEIAA